MSEYFLRTAREGSELILTKIEPGSGGEKRTGHTVECMPGTGRWIADGRYDVTNIVNATNGAYLVAAVVGERDYDDWKIG